MICGGKVTGADDGGLKPGLDVIKARYLGAKASGFGHRAD